MTEWITSEKWGWQTLDHTVFVELLDGTWRVNHAQFDAVYRFTNEGAAKTFGRALFNLINQYEGELL